MRARVQVQWANEARRAAKTAELRAHTVPQLRALCAEHGLHKAGVKAALVARLCDALCSAEPGGEAAEDGGVHSTLAPICLMRWRLGARLRCIVWICYMPRLHMWVQPGR